MLAWYPPVLDDVEDLRGLLDNDDIKPDEELATRLFELLVSNWPRGQLGVDALRPKDRKTT